MENRQRHDYRQGNGQGYKHCYKQCEVGNGRHSTHHSLNHDEGKLLGCQGLRFFGLLFFGLVCGAFPSWGQDFNVQGGYRQVLPSRLVHFVTTTAPSEVRAGEHFRVLVTATIVRDWHIYSVISSDSKFGPQPTQLTVGETSMKVLGKVYETNPLLKEDRSFNIKLALHKNTARFYHNFQVPAEVLSYGPTPIPLKIRWQVCNDQYCTRAVSNDLQAIVHLSKGEKRAAYTYMERSVDYIDKQGKLHASPDNLQAVLFSGIGRFLLLAASFGLFALLTPCVFPLIPVTVSFFMQPQGRELKTNSSQARFKLALAFGLGIIFSITSLGFGATLLFGATGILRFAAHPLVNLVIGSLFILFGLSLLGLFSFSLPSRFINSFVRWSQKVKGTGGIILMGMAFAVTSFTCTAPFVGTLLLASTQGQIFWPLIGMLTYATVFALPFILLSLSPRLLRAMQGKSGNWISHFRIVLGLIELMAALKFISNADVILGWGIFTRTNLLTLWSILAAVIALVLVGIPPLSGLGRIAITKFRLLLALCFASLATYFALGSSGRILNAYVEAYLPPPTYSSSPLLHFTLPGRGTANSSKNASSLRSHDLPWHETLKEALKQAKQQKKPVFLDFTGYTCTNCRWMEARVFSDSLVYQIFKDKFVLAKLYTDGGPHKKANQDLQLNRFQTIALPYYVILSPHNVILWRHAGVVSTPAEFAERLNQTLRNNATRLVKPSA